MPTCSQWEPISKSELQDLIKKAECKMSPRESAIWETIRILPQKWQEPKYGEEGDGFWVVAIYGNSVIWYNDIEEGFNTSSYGTFGIIDEYYCDQLDLNHLTHRLKDKFT